MGRAAVFCPADGLENSLGRVRARRSQRQNRFVRRLLLRHIDALRNTVSSVNLGCFGISALLHCRHGLDREAPISDSPSLSAAPRAHRALPTFGAIGGPRTGGVAWRGGRSRAAPSMTARFDGPRGLAAQLGLGAF